MNMPETPEPVNPEAQTIPGAPAVSEAQSMPEAGSFPETQVPFSQMDPVASAGAVPPRIVGYCRECGKALDAASARRAFGTIYCEEHRPGQPVAEHGAGGAQHGPFPSPPPLPYTAPAFHQNPPSYPYPAPPSPAARAGDACGSSPALAFLLGMIPGVGAVYNGQYAKGLIHVVIFGLAISAVSSGYFSGIEPVGGLFITCFWFYMAFEAYHTAKKRQAGVPLDEFSSVFPMRGGAARIPVGSHRADRARGPVPSEQS